MNVIAEMARKEGIEPSEKSGNRDAIAHSYKNLIAAAIISGKARKSLGTLNVLASLHAAIRLDKRKKLEINDLPDFDHAAAALVYCDAFFTERALSALVTQTNISLNSLYTCEVLADPRQALEWVLGLAPTPPL